VFEVFIILTTFEDELHQAVEGSLGDTRLC